MKPDREQYLGRLTPASAQAIVEQADVVFKMGNLPEDPRLSAAHTFRNKTTAQTVIFPQEGSIQLK